MPLTAGEFPTRLERTARIGYPSGAMQEPPKLILASTSPYRRGLLDRLGVSFDVVAPLWDEIRRNDPDATVQANAQGKARSVAIDHPQAAILGSDQVASCEGRILEKPGTEDSARRQLAWLAGKDHTLHTCVMLRTPDGRERMQTVVARLRIRSLSDAQITSYVRSDAPLDCAGSYRSEGFGIVLFDYIRCDDPTAIEGLPLIATRRLLEDAGWKLLSDVERGA